MQFELHVVEDRIETLARPSMTRGGDDVTEDIAMLARESWARSWQIERQEWQERGQHLSVIPFHIDNESNSLKQFLKQEDLGLIFAASIKEGVGLPESFAKQCSHRSS